MIEEIYLIENSFSKENMMLNLKNDKMNKKIEQAARQLVSTIPLKTSTPEEIVRIEMFKSGAYFMQKEYEDKFQKAILALKFEISYPDCTLINSRGDTFTFKNNNRNEGLIDFLLSHEEGLKSF